MGAFRGRALQSPATEVPSLRFSAAGRALDRVVVLLTGVDARAVEQARLKRPPDAEDVFYLALKTAGSGAAPVPLLARVTTPAAHTLQIEPAVSLTPGHTYVAVFDGPRISPALPRLSAEYTLPLPSGESPVRVSGVYPTQAELPANLLKLYVHFSGPMAAGGVFDHVRLLDSRGEPVSQAFREVELWADDHRRLTLWISPGRIKRALGLSEGLGPVLQPGRQYTVEITPGLRDQRGLPLVRPFRRVFRTVGFDRTQPTLQTWQIDAPGPGSREPLRVRFPEVMDHAMAGRVLALETSGGMRVAGVPSASDDGRSWSFLPAQPWTTGDYTLVADGDLEDLAGNSLLRPFEAAPGQAPDPAAEPPRFRRAFRIATGNGR